MPGPSKSAWNNWRNRVSLSVRGTFLLRTSTARVHNSFIKAFASAAMAFGGAAGDALAISSDTMVRRKRRVISAKPPGSRYRRRFLGLVLGFVYRLEFRAPLDGDRAGRVPLASTLSEIRIF